MESEGFKLFTVVLLPDSRGKFPTAIFKTMQFPKGRRIERFGELYEIDWFDYIRGKRKAPFETGKVTFYNLFKNVWESSEHVSSPDTLEIPMGEDEVSYV